MSEGQARAKSDVPTRSVPEPFGLLQSLLDNSDAVIYVKDVDGRYLLVNRGYQRRFGRGSEEVRGRTDLELWPDSTAASFRAQDRQVLESGESMQFEEVVPHADGPHTYFTIKFPLRDPQEQIYAMGGISTEITDRKLAEEKLKRSERQLIEAQTYGEIGSWEWDIASDTVSWSDQLYRIYGLDPQQFPATYQSYLDRTHPEDREVVRGAIERALRSREPFEHETRIVRPDGKVRVLYSRGQVVLDDRGQPVRMVGVCQDITVRRQLEEQLRQSQKMEAVGRLAGGIAHDFNNLLTAIMGYSSLLLESSLGHKPQLALEQIHHAAERGAALTRQLLAFSRRQVLVPEVLDLGAFVLDLSKMLWRLIGEDIKLSTDIHPGTGCVRADRGQLTQVVLNLAVNARDAMPEGGKLLLEVRDAFARDAGEDLDPSAFVVLSVTDTGKGIDEETLRHLFEPFYTTKQLGSGTGLGLATVYGIVEQSGGRIRVESAAGHGTTFQIFLPRAGEAATEQAEGQRASTLPKGSETILLVEDEDTVRRLSREVLESSGYYVIDAASGAEALERFASHRGPVHLLLTDVVMPGLSGREIAERLHASVPGLKTLYMSGYTDDAVVRRGIRTHAAAFLEKPFTPRTLLSKVREVLDES